jgi:hypothetical protein
VIATVAVGGGLVAGGAALRRHVRRVERGEVLPASRTPADDSPREPDAWGD